MTRSTSCGSLILKTLAAVLAAVVVLTLPLGLLARNAADVLFSPQAMSRVLAKGLVDSGMLRRAVVENLVSGASSGGAPLDLRGALATLPAEKLDAITSMLMPDAWIKDQITALSTSLYAWIDSSEAAPSISIDLTAVQDRLLHGGAAQLVETVVGAWPPCTPDQLAALRALAAGKTTASIPYCQPPEPYRAVVLREGTRIVREQAASLPPTISIGSGAFGEGAANLAGVRDQLRLVRFVARWGVLIPLSLMGVIMALAVRSWKGLALWWGVPLLLAGLLAFVPVVVGPALARQALARMVAASTAPPLVGDILSNLGSGLIEEILRVQAWQAFLVAGVGLVLTLLGLLLKGKPPAPVAVPSSASVTRAQAPPAQPPSSPPPAAGAPKGKDTPSGMFG